ncbi:ExeM/NucH family extracellular endonuclease [Marinobacteraceae bacterium S3BR75-40.1]
MPAQTALILLLLFPAWALAACGDPATPVGQVQGAGATSPLQHKTVTLEARVTGVFTGPGQWRGFYLLEDPGDQDGNPRTSEGLFVFAPEAEVRRGQRVRLSGRVKEYHGLTEVVAGKALQPCGTYTPQTPPALNLAELTPDSLEARESMPVRLEAATIIDLYHLGRFGVLSLAARRPFVSDPGSPGMSVLLDDGRRTQHVAFSSLPLQPQPEQRPPRRGDRVSGGPVILDYRYGDWRLQPVAPLQWVAANPRPEAPDAPSPGTLRVAAFNLHNYFNGPDFPTSRGVKSRAEYVRQTEKLVAAIQGLKADVLAVAELENDGSEPHPAGAQLADALDGQWRWLQPPEGHLGTDAIAVGILYNRDRVEPVGKARVPESWARGNRRPVAQRFRARADGVPFILVPVHLQSKRCHGKQKAIVQGCSNDSRVRAARLLAQWLANHYPGEPVVLAGDFNAYAGEPPLQALQEAGFRRILPGREAEDDYTYVYRGRAGALDHILVTAEAADRLRDRGVWHVNADEWRGLEGASGPWRSSDHDPVFVDLR